MLTPIEVHFSKAKWDIVEKLRAQDEIALVDLKTDRIVARTVRDKFIRYNKPWLRDNMHEIFTPRTLFLYRKEIINQFERVVGKKQPVNISLSSKKSTASKEVSSLEEQNGSFDKDYYDKHFKIPPPRMQQIIRFWILRGKNIKNIRRQVSTVIDSNMDTQCLYCGSTFGLMVQCIQNIEDTFHEFLKLTGYRMSNYKVSDWQRYFKAVTSFRTVCSLDTRLEHHHDFFKKISKLNYKNQNIRK